MRELLIGDQVITRRKGIVPHEYKVIGTIKMISDVTGDITVDFPNKVMIAEKGYTLKCNKSAIVSVEDVIDEYYNMTDSDKYKFHINDSVYITDMSKYVDVFGENIAKYNPIGTIIDVVYGLYIVQFINGIDLTYLNVEVEEGDLEALNIKSTVKSSNAVERDEDNYNSYPVSCSSKIEVGDVVIPYDYNGCNLIIDKFEDALKGKGIDLDGKEVSGNGIVAEAYTPAYNPNVEAEPTRLLDIRFNVLDEESGKAIDNVTLTDIPETKVCHMPIAFDNDAAKARYVNDDWDYYNAIVEEMAKVITPYGNEKETPFKLGDIVSFPDNRAYTWVSNDVIVTKISKLGYFGRVMDTLKNQKYHDMIIAKFPVVSEETDEDNTFYIDILIQSTNLVHYTDVDASDDAIKYNWCERAEDYKNSLETVIAQESESTSK